MNRWLSACWKQRLLNNPILRSNSIFSPVCRNSVLGNWTRRRQTKVKSHLDALFNRFWSLKTSSNGWFPCSAKPIVYLIIHWVSSSQCPREREILSSICLEYAVALLMNLCLRTQGRRKCAEIADQAINVLSSLLTHPNQEVSSEHGRIARTFSPSPRHDPMWILLSTRS